MQVDARNVGLYESSDLDYFQGILDNILRELKESDGSDHVSRNPELLKVRVATAIFKCAEDGERDAARLRERVLGVLAEARG